MEQNVGEVQESYQQQTAYRETKDEAPEIQNKDNFEDIYYYTHLNRMF